MMAPKTSKIEHKPLPIVLSGMSQHDTPTQPDAFCAEAFAHEPIQNPERHRWGRFVSPALLCVFETCVITVLQNIHSAVPSGHAPAIDLVGMSLENMFLLLLCSVWFIRLVQVLESPSDVVTRVLFSCKKQWCRACIARWISPWSLISPLYLSGFRHLCVVSVVCLT
jgi:hypothetical protein